jgi:hypothetical protein
VKPTRHCLNFGVVFFILDDKLADPLATATPPRVQNVSPWCQSGSEKYYGGFGGKCLDKLDATRALEEKKREKCALKIDDDDESEEDACW